MAGGKPKNQFDNTMQNAGPNGGPQMPPPINRPPEGEGPMGMQPPAPQGGMGSDQEVMNRVRGPRFFMGYSPMNNPGRPPRPPVKRPNMRY